MNLLFDIVRPGITVSISGFHPGDPGSIPGVGIFFSIYFSTNVSHKTSFISLNEFIKLVDRGVSFS